MSDQKVTAAATNIYTVLDNELARMHSLLRMYLELPKDSPHNTRYTPSSTTINTPSPYIGIIYKRILELQNAVLKAAGTADAEIQKAVAELALTGEYRDNK